MVTALVIWSDGRLGSNFVYQSNTAKMSQKLYIPQPITGDEREARRRERDRLIAVRWWWLSHHLNLRTSYVLEILSRREFYLQERYIMRIIEEQDMVIRSMTKHRPSAREVSRLYPSFVWRDGASM